MKNKRLQEIAKFITKEDNVVDIGTDHGYLAIYLKEEIKCQNVIASDISTSALNAAKKNIKAQNLTSQIPCLLSNGFEKIPIKKIDTAIIAGMGTHTILEILNHPKSQELKKIIVQSNNDFELLRRNMKKQGYALKKEAYVEEKGHPYFIMEYQKGEDFLTEIELKYGMYNEKNKEYYQKCFQKLHFIRKNLPLKQWKRKRQIKKEEKKLLEYIKR